MTNDGYGLLRVLGPDIGAFITATLVIVIVALVVNRFIGAGAAHEPSISHSDVVGARRTTRRIAFWLWLFVLATTLAHAASVAVSLRIPRSDVDPSGVYQRMNDATQGHPR